MIHTAPVQRRSFQTPLPDERGLSIPLSNHLWKPKLKLPAQANSSRRKNTMNTTASIPKDSITSEPQFRLLGHTNDLIFLSLFDFDFDLLLPLLLRNFVLVFTRVLQISLLFPKGPCLISQIMLMQGGPIVETHYIWLYEGVAVSDWGSGRYM